MLTLTPQDINAIADAVAARLIASMQQSEQITTTKAEINMVMATGIDPVEYLRGKGKIKTRGVKGK